MDGGLTNPINSRRVDHPEFDCAIKVFDPSAFIANRDKALTRFQREVRILSQLQHRAIVPYFDAGLNKDGTPYLVMPLIEGRDLRSATEGMDFQRILWLFLEFLEGLAFAHNRNVLHRDLKPSNIIVRESDTQPVILDFGCAYFLDENELSSLTTAAVGSQGYIPSEVIADPTLRTTQHDIFSCGIILYELLARRQPDPRDYKSLTQINPAFAIVDDVVQKAIAPASARISAVDELLELTRQCYDIGNTGVQVSPR